MELAYEILTRWCNDGYSDPIKEALDMEKARKALERALVKDRGNEQR